MESLQILSLGRNLLKKIEGLDPVAETLEELWLSYNNITSLVRFLNALLPWGLSPLPLLSFPLSHTGWLAGPKPLILCGCRACALTRRRVLPPAGPTARLLRLPRLLR